MAQGKPFWSSKAMEPKRKYRWVLEVGGLPQYIITRVDRPSWTVTPTEHNYINHKFYYPGRVEWQPVKFSLVDPVGPDATAILTKMLLASGYRFPNDQNSTRTISKQEAVNAVQSVTITLFGGDSSGLTQNDNAAIPVEKWMLTNAWISNWTMGDLDYSADEMVNMEIELRYDFAKLMAIAGRDTTIPNPAVVGVSDQQLAGQS